MGQLSQPHALVWGKSSRPRETRELAGEDRSKCRAPVFCLPLYVAYKQGSGCEVLSLKWMKVKLHIYVVLKASSAE